MELVTRQNLMRWASPNQFNTVSSDNLGRSGPIQRPKSLRQIANRRQKRPHVTLGPIMSLRIAKISAFSKSTLRDSSYCFVSASISCAWIEALAIAESLDVSLNRSGRTLRLAVPDNPQKANFSEYSAKSHTFQGGGSL